MRVSVVLVAAAAAVLAAVAVVDAALPPMEQLLISAEPDTPGSKGTKFLVGFMQNILPRDPLLATPDAYFMVSTNEDGLVEFDITTRFGGNEVVATHQVTSAEPVRINFNPDEVYVTDGFQRDRAIWVQTREQKKIALFVINDEAFSTDGFVALPCDSMVVPGDYRRYEYVVLSARQDVTSQQGSTIRASQFLLITCEDDTVVTITPSTTISIAGVFSQTQFGPTASSTSAEWEIGNSDEIPAKQTLLVAVNGNDFTGTIVRSSKPLVVISGHQCGQVPDRVTACDHMATQIPPNTAWGRTFLLNPLDVRLTGDLYRFATSTDDTRITITCVDDGGSTPTIDYEDTLNRQVGTNWDQFETHSEPCNINTPFVSRYCCLESSKPIVLAQYSYGHSADEGCGKSSGDLGDPFMSVIPPVIQYLNRYHLVPVNGSAGEFTFKRLGVSVYVQYFQPSRIMLDDVPLEPDRTRWQAIYCGTDICGYATTRVLQDRDHVVYHEDQNAALFVHSYGFFLENSYALAGGMELQPVAGTTVTCAAPPECVEEGTAVTIVCTRGQDVTVQTRIMVTSEDGTAMAPGDYNELQFPGIGGGTLPDNVLNYRGGNNPNNQVIELSFTVQVNSDSDDGEVPETFFINVTPLRTAVVFTPRVTVTICGVGGVTVFFDPTDYTVTEGVDGTADLIVMREGDLSRETVVTVTTSSGTATVGDDFAPTTMTVTFQPGETSVIVPVPILDDSLIEPTEVFSASLSTTDSTVTVGDDTATVDILDNDECPILPTIPNGLVIQTGTTTGDVATYTCNQGFELNGPPTRVCMSDSTWSGQAPECQSLDVTVSFDPTDYTVTEGVDDFANLMLVRSGDLSRETVVTVTTAPGSADAGSDYTSVTFEVTFAIGFASATVPVPIIDDNTIEGPEIFTASLSTTQTNVIFGDDTATVTILDTDECPPLPAIPNGIVSLSGVTAGSTASYICNAMYELVGPSTRVCMTDSTWSGQEPTCRPLCPDLTDPANGAVMMMGNSVGDMATYTCNDGFELDGVMMVTCQSDGQWDNPPPICRSLEVIVDFDPILYTVTEGVDGVAVLTLVRSGDLTGETTIDLSFTSGTASAGSDYTPSPATVTFPPGETTATFQVPILNDFIEEDDETFTVIASTPDTNVMVREDTATVTILDNDVPMPQFEEDMYIVPENNRSVPLCVDLGVEPSQTRTYPITAKSKDPPDAQEADFYPSTSITIGPPDSKACIDFMDLVVDDSIALEGDQSFTICVGNSTAMVFILDDDIPIIESDDIIINEDGGSAVVVVRLVNEIEKDLTLDYGTGEVPNGAIEDDDYTGERGSIIFVPSGPGPQSAEIEIPINDDQETEMDEPLIVSFSSEDIPDDFQNNIPSPVVTIIDNDVVVGFFPTIYTVMEGVDTFVTLTLFRTGNINLTASVDLTTVPGSAVETSDYDPITRTVVFGPGETTATVDVPITDDEILEDIETFSATLTSDLPNVVVQADNSNADITIGDNDRVTIGFVETMYSVDEDEGPAVLSVGVLFGELSEEVVVSFTTQDGSATDPNDYTSVSQLLTFGPGQTTQNVPVAIVNDNVYELNSEEFMASLELVTTGVDVQVMPSEATVRIRDNDFPFPMFEFPMYTVPEGDPGSVPLCLNISVEITEPITYTITTGHKSPPEAEDSDFTAGTTITIQPPGPASYIDFTDLIVNDNLGLEGDEAFALFIIDTPAMTMVTIIDDDEVSVGFEPINYMVLEGDSTELIVVRRGDAEEPVEVIVGSNDGTATGGEDYFVLDGIRVVFPPGVFSQTVTLNTITDVPAEGNEDLDAVLGVTDTRVGIFEPTANVIITEEIIPTISFTTEDVTVGEGDGTAEVCLMLSVPLSTDLEVDVTSSPGTATSSDFLPETLIASFAAGATEACVEFIVINDPIALEGDETFDVDFDPPEGILPGTPPTATVTIIDDDEFVIQFTEEDYRFDEGDPDAEVCLQGTGEIAQPATATVSSIDIGTASAGLDYIAVVSETVVFIPGGPNTLCIEVDLVDDDVAEGEESFPLTIEAVSPTPGVVTGTQDDTTVIIGDTDMVRIGFDPTIYNVGEEDGSAVVTVRVLAGTLSSPVVVRLTTQDGSAGDPEDYSGVVVELTFTPTEPSIDVMIPLTNDNVFEPDIENFEAELTLVTAEVDVDISPDRARVNILDNEAPFPMFEFPMYTVPEGDPGSVPLCVNVSVEITEPITYDIVTGQKSPPEAEDSDFTAGTTITIQPPGPVSCIDFTDLIVNDDIALEGDEAFSLFIVDTPAMAMVTIIDDDVPMLSSPDETVPETIGNAEVCVTLNNPIESSFTVIFETTPRSAKDPDDFTTVAGEIVFLPEGETEMCEMIPIEDDDVQEPSENFDVVFTPDSPGAPPSTATVTIFDNDQIGTIVNDSVIGDPLFTVTLPQENEFMCYEVHGEAGKYFNLVSDTCTSVNALFTALPDEDRINRMSEIGIYAMDSSGDCVEIRISLDGCSGYLNGESLNMTYKQDGVSVKRYLDRWRVSVPNCGTTKAVMWIFCDSGPDMLRFHIARGNNLAPTSHGLLAQFWNIPVNIGMQDGEIFVELFNQSHDSYRRIPAFLAPRTWDHTKAPCYYVGNAQGGPSQSQNPRESVIEGKVRQYETGSLFSTSFDFEQFDELSCVTSV